MAGFAQSNRIMQYFSPSGKDVLLIESLDGAEGISRLFEYHAELLVARETTIDATSIIGSKVSVAVNLNDVPGARWISGIVASFEQREGDAEFNVFRARIVPSMWQLTLSTNCRIFQNKTVMDIVKEVIGEYGLSLADQTTETYKQLEYCTQYSESDFHFVSRLLEESGIFYWFEHSAGDNKIVFGDGRSAYQDCPLASTIAYARNSRGAEGSYGSLITDFTSTATMISGKHSTSDYTYRNFARADAPDKTSASLYGKNAFDQYLYPAGVEGYANDATQTTTDLETLFITARATASDATAEVYHGSSNARTLCAGYTFTMTENRHPAWNSKYLLTAVTMHVDQVPSYRADSFGASGKRDGYSNGFTAVSSNITYKPPQSYSKPKIYGPQTATVVGPSGEEIYLDSLGRAKVQFFWDKLDSKGSTQNTTWVRVAQGWAGNAWGAHFWPRVKDEVVIQFLNGDPDNPVITGSVYNGKNSPPYTLPDSGTKSGVLSRSSKGGGAANANEWRFEDKKGSEQVYIHAEKDMDQSIEHDRRIAVGNNDSLTITGNQTEQVQGNYNLQVKGDSVQQIMGKSDLGIVGNLSEQVTGSHSMSISSSEAIQVSQAYSMDAGTTVYIKGGMTVVIEAGLELSLVASGGFIDIGPAGVAISGTMVLINSGGAAASGSAGSITPPGTPGTPDKAEGAT